MTLPAHARRVVGPALLATGLLLFAPVAAVAATDAESPPANLAVSHDGTTFTHGSDVALFTDPALVVPGDISTERVWLRNDAPDEGLLTIRIVDAWSDDIELASATELSLVDAEGEELGRVSVADAMEADGCAVLSGGMPLDPGQVMRLDAAIDISPRLGSNPDESGREGAQATVSFQMRATLTDADAGPDDVDVCPPPDAGPPEGEPPPEDDDLPATGGLLNSTALTAVGLLLGGGITALILARSRRDHA